MARTIKQFTASQTLTASAATYYTTPANTTSVITRASFTNTDTVARTVTVHHIASGGSATAANKIVDARSIAPNETYVPPQMEGLVMPTGSFIQALASTATIVNIAISGAEIVQ